LGTRQLVPDLLSAHQVDYADLSDNEIVSMQGLEVPQVVAGKIAACRAVCQGVALLIRMWRQVLLSVAHLDLSHNMIYEMRSAFAPLPLVRFNVAHNHLENLFGLEVTTEQFYL
jgi:hypothetical protein